MRLRELGSGEERDCTPSAVPAGTSAVRVGDVAWVWHLGETYRVAAVVASSRSARRPEDAPALTAPMPGRVVSVRVRAGAAVGKGDILVIVEAMKMEHAVRAPRDGTVARVLVSDGRMVGLGDVLVELA